MPDKLNAGLPSDRIYVEWPIGHDRTYKRLKGEDNPPPLEDAEREGIAYKLRAAGDRPGKVVAAGRDWRLGGREAIEAAFARGYAAVEFLRGKDGRGAYLLVPQPRRDAEVVDTDE